MTYPINTIADDSHLLTQIPSRTFFAEPLKEPYVLNHDQSLIPRAYELLAENPAHMSLDTGYIVGLKEPTCYTHRNGNRTFEFYIIDRNGHVYGSYALFEDAKGNVKRSFWIYTKNIAYHAKHGELNRKENQ